MRHTNNICFGVTSGKHHYEDVGYGASCLHCGQSAPEGEIVHTLLDVKCPDPPKVKG